MASSRSSDDGLSEVDGLRAGLEAALPTPGEAEREQAPGEGGVSIDEDAGSTRVDEDDPAVLTGPQLRQLVKEKWGATYDVRINRRRNSLGQLRFYVQVMWKFLEQKSFPLSEDEYDEQIAAVAELITEWGQAEYVRAEIAKTNKRPVIGHTVGGGAKCVSIPLEVDFE